MKSKKLKGICTMLVAALTITSVSCLAGYNSNKVYAIERGDFADLVLGKIDPPGKNQEEKEVTIKCFRCGAKTHVKNNERIEAKVKNNLDKEINLSDLNLKFYYSESNADGVEEAIEDIYAATIDGESEEFTNNLEASINKDAEGQRFSSNIYMHKLVNIKFNEGTLKPGQSMIVKFNICVKHANEDKDIYPAVRTAEGYINGEIASLTCWAHSR